MKYIITKEQIIRMNQTVSNSYGKDSYLVDPISLDQMVAETYAKDQNDNFYIYKNTLEKAAKMYSLFQINKPFEEYNEKTGLLYLLTMLDVNNMRIDTNDEILLELMTGSGTYEEALDWIVKYCHLSKADERMALDRYPNSYKKRLVRTYL